MDAVDDRETALKRGDELWATLQAALDSHLDEPVGSNTDWTGHDVYSHFAHWQTLTIANMRKILAGDSVPPPEADEDTLNNRWRAEDRTLPTEEVRERCLATRAELRQMLMQITPEQWQQWGRIASEDISGGHYEHHLAACG
jgi:Mycothiol maleylpyruvate isomerase N-terminal domain